MLGPQHELSIRAHALSQLSAFFIGFKEFRSIIGEIDNSILRGENDASTRGNQRNKGPILLAASSAILLGTSAFAQVLYFDTNGTSANFGSPTTTSQAAWGTWTSSNTVTDWNTSSKGTSATQAWVSGDVADFVSADPTGKGAEITLSGTPISVGGLTYSGDPTTIGGALGTGTGLNFGSGNTTITDAVNAKQIIEAPISGSGTITITTTASGTAGAIDFAGYTDCSASSTSTQFAGFTGNLVATNGYTTPSTSNYGTLYLDSSLGSSSSTITLNPFMELADSYYTSGFYTPSFTLSNAVILNNTNSVAGATYIIAAANGSGGVEHTETYAGVISSNGGPINLQINGNGGDVILGAANTYSGSTYITTVTTSGGGIAQLGVDNAIPASSTLNFGPASGGSPTVGPFDLNGHNLTVAGLSTQTNLTTSNGQGGVDVGNIYNTSTNGNAPNTVTLTVNVPTGTNDFYKGDIGDTNLNVEPFNLNAPFLNSTQAGTNINLVLNGPGTQTLDPVPNQTKGDEYTGKTTVNGGTLVLGRGGNSDPNATYTGGPGVGLPGPYYTLSNSSVGDITVNNGATLASVKSNSTGFVGGSAGNINLLPGSQFLPGTANNVGTFVTNNLTVDSGASMTFDIASNSSFDYVVIQGTLTMDSAGQHTVNINNVGSMLYAGTYTLIQAVNNYFNWDGTNGFVLGTTPTGTGDTFALSIYNNYELQLTVTAPVLQWDPTGQGLASANGTIIEGGGTWTSASQFYDFTATPPGDVSWPDGTTKTAEFGNDATQAGGQVVLGQNIVLGGQLEFGPILAGSNYSIVNASGNNFTLTIAGGINVNNAAATSTTPSAEIDVPIVLSGSQMWNIVPGQFLTVTNTITETDAPTNSDTLTISGGGVLDLTDTSGNTSFANLDIANGTVLLGAYNSLGTVPVTLDGGALEFSGTGTLANTVSITSNGGAIGTTTGTLTINQNLGGATAGTLDIIGSGNTTINGALTVKTFQNSSSGTTTLTNAGNTMTAVTLSSGSLQISAAADLDNAPITLSGGNASLVVPGISALTNNISSGTSASNTLTIDSSAGTTPLTLSGISVGQAELRSRGRSLRSWAPIHSPAC